MGMQRKQTVRETSVAAFLAIQESGLLSRRRLEVYEVLSPDGPLTATQIAERMRGHKSSSVGANVHARLCELREMDAVEELGTITCPITNMTVILWDVTGRLPIKRKKIERVQCHHCFGRGYVELDGEQEILL